MLACYLTLRGYKMYNTLACTVAVPHALRWSITSVVFSVWVSLIVFGVVKGALACANWAQVHWEEVPAHLLSATHLVWFAWGCLILYGRSPSLVSAFSFLMLLPAKVRLSRFRRFSCLLFGFVSRTSLSRHMRCGTTAQPRLSLPRAPGVAHHGGCDPLQS
jgi:hypothetical protein